MTSTPTAYALLSCRPQLAQRLQAAGCPALRIVFQCDASSPLPALHQGQILLLDTVGLSIADLLITLNALAHRCVLTIAIIDPADRLAQRLLVLCPTVRAIVSDQADLALLPTLTRYVTQSQAGQLIGVELPPHTEPILPPRTLPLLLALMQASKHRRTAALCGLSRANLYRLISDVRLMLGFTTEPNTLPSVLFGHIIAHLTDLPALHPLPLRRWMGVRLRQYTFSAAGQLVALSPGDRFEARHHPSPAPRPLTEKQRLAYNRRKRQRSAEMTEAEREAVRRKAREHYAQMTKAQKDAQRRKARERKAQRRTQQEASDV